MLTVIDIDEATIEAVATAKQWEREFQEAFTRPVQVMQATMSLLAVPPEFGKMIEGQLGARAQRRSEKMRAQNSAAQNSAAQNNPRRTYGQPV